MTPFTTQEVESGGRRKGRGREVGMGGTEWGRGGRGREVEMVRAGHSIGRYDEGL